MRRSTLFVLAVLGLAVLLPAIPFSPFATAQSRHPYEAAHRQMIEEVIIGGGVTEPRVVQAMRDTLRHEFVTPGFRRQAYFDMSLPIGDSQTISSPYIVAFMTQAIDPQPTDRVLEIGTGSGYQAAVLSPLVDEVYTIEIVEPLGRRAEATLKRLGYDNVHVRVGDGFRGWPEHAPFDKIIVTCSPEQVPVPLVEQLRDGGLMVIPVGERYQQVLYILRKENGKLVSKALQPTLFVPMTGAAEEERSVFPDPRNPEVVNGDFEASSESETFIAGWYYQRLAERVRGDARQGEHYVRFQNDALGRPAYILQGLPVDGESIRALRIGSWVRLRNVRDAGRPTEHATIAITFYDENRQDLGLQTLGRLRGSHDWRRIEKSVRVPPAAKEMLLRVGLFGATGEAHFDDIRLDAIQN
jgi:protein-L-isoaspartate(D-aspartate) O-methyltransferase